MLNLSGGDIAILVVAGYVSMVTLVRLMRHRRDEVVAQFQTQVEAAKKRKQDEERHEKRHRAQHTRRNRGGELPDKRAA